MEKNKIMKKIQLIFAVIVFFSSMSLFHACKDDTPDPIVYKAAVPQNPTPGDEAVVNKSGTTYSLTWEGTSEKPYDLYIGTSDSPPLAKAGITTNSYNFETSEGGLYYWYLQTVDHNGIVSKSPTWSFFVNSKPGAPTIISPVDGATDVAVNGTVEWDALDAEGDALTFDVYFGTTNPPSLVAAGVEDYSFTPSMEANTKYYWKVVAKDEHGYVSDPSPVWSFTSGAEPIMTFTGLYNCDEPAESYFYDVTFAKKSSTQISTDNYWNSGWVGVFDIDMDKLTYSMPYTTWSAGYSGIESGTINPTNGTMIGTYTIFKNGASIEQGVHTYTKK